MALGESAISTPDGESGPLTHSPPLHRRPCLCLVEDGGCWAAGPGGGQIQRLWAEPQDQLNWYSKLGGGVWQPLGSSSG